MQFTQTVFQLNHLTTTPNKLFTMLTICLLVLDWLQIASFATDQSLLQSTIIGVDISLVQSGLAHTRVGWLMDLIGSNGLLVLGTVILLFFAIFFTVCFFTSRAIQRNQPPNITLVRFIRVTLILTNTAGFIPIFSVIVQLIITYASQVIDNGFDILSLIVVIVFTTLAVTIATQVVFSTLISFPNTLTSKNPLARMHSRVDIVYLIAKIITVTMYQISFFTDRPTVLAVWMGVFVTVTMLAYTVFLPYYNILTTVVRVTALYLILVLISLSFSWTAAIILLAMTPLTLALPVASFYATEGPMIFFRNRMRQIVGDDIYESETVDDLMHTVTRVPLIFPYQAEIAVRYHVWKIQYIQRRIKKIESEAPISLLEFNGAVENDGEFNFRAMPQDVRTRYTQLVEEANREVAFVIRLYQAMLSRWRTRPFPRMAFIHFVACFRPNSLPNAINGAHQIWAKTLSIDNQYFAFVCNKYSTSLQGSSSIMDRLEAQRNLNIINKCQKQLADQLSRFWVLVAQQRTHAMTLPRLNTFVKTINDIQAKMVSTEKLYAKMLRDPTPRLLRAYSNFVALFYRQEVCGEYLKELESTADEIEVVHMNSNGDIVRKKRIGRVTMFEAKTKTASFVSLHIRAFLSIVLIAALFAVSILVTVVSLKMCSFVTWQLITASGVGSCLHLISMALSTLRGTGSPVYLVSAIQCTGPLWQAIAQEVTELYVQATLKPYYGVSIPIYLSNSLEGASEDPYAIFDTVDEGFYSKVSHESIKYMSQVFYHITDFFNAETIAVMDFEGGVTNGTHTDSLYNFITNAISIADNVGTCFVRSDAADIIADCTDGITDDLYSIEYTITEYAMDGLFNVIDQVYTITQMFLTIELLVFIIVFVLFVSLFLFVATTLYVLPLTQGLDFTVTLIQLFTKIPSVTVDEIIADFHKKKVQRRQLAMDTHRESFTDLNAMSERQSIVDDTFELINDNSQLQPVPVPKAESPQSDGALSSDSQKHSVNFNLKTQLLSTGGEFAKRVAANQEAMPQALPPQAPEDIEAESVDSMYSYDTDDNNSEARAIRDIISEAESNEVSIDEDEVAQLELQDVTGPTPAESTDSDSDASHASEKSGVRQNLATRINRKTIQATAAIREIPFLFIWLVLFAAVFLGMTMYAVYNTGDVTQTAHSMFVHYRGLSTLARANQFIASSAWEDLSPAVMNTTVATDSLSGRVMDVLDSVSPFLSGSKDGQVKAITDRAWELSNYPGVVKILTEGILDILAGDHWAEGLYSDAIDFTLHGDSCLRLNPDSCELERPSESFNGLQAFLPVYIAHVDVSITELKSGLLMGPSQTFINETQPLDMLGGSFSLQLSLRSRFIDLIDQTQTNVLVFFGVFVVLLAVFYFFYLYKAIVNLSKVRQQFALTFHSLPRAGIPTEVVEAFLELFPDDEVLDA
ncbi:tmcB-like protein [Carpediemonas membranifera]|uniref:TmcB-like protein n=1 Tax=Carpediemonas membranifera TaxID=201153 RepID=A0A8J6EB96_9EUKA|nr:tmcB-like protein [Carpediemonas membranifera]|eukprot:KAG9396625.1 tmcB-like protein [Carpediemonas membranifera]